jgi:uncharacterized membrane protein
MFIRAAGSRSRSLAMAISWRFVGSLDTFILSFLILYVTGHGQQPMAAMRLSGAIALAETGTKVLLFYIHDRIWGTIPWGRPDMVQEPVGADESNY